MGLKTPLHADHLAASARMVDFGGWDMPLHYGSQIEEHHAVRKRVGIFDVSHMTVVDVKGEAAQEFLRILLANDVAKLRATGSALYTCMLNPAGGVIDDLIVYLLAESNYRLVVNAATREKDLAWIRQQAASHPVAVLERAELAMIAVQGPLARDLATDLIDQQWRAAVMALKPFNALQAGSMFVACTGYTGEDGFEIILAENDASALWQALLGRGAVPCGLGARDTLRLEAGLNLYGNDMDEQTSPLEAGLGWTIAWDPEDRAFVGRDALAALRKQSAMQRFTGLLLEGRGVLRNHQRVVTVAGDGEITSGGFSPTLERSVALARLPEGDYNHAQVDIRGRLQDAKVVNPPFVRNGRIRIEL